jgi:hypothetical protein
LTYIFIIVSCLLFGGLAGHEIGYSGRAKLVAQRDKSLKLAEEYKALMDRTEQAALKCIDQIITLRTLGESCCDAAERALNERDACRKEHGNKR